MNFSCQRCGGDSNGYEQCNTCFILHGKPEPLRALVDCDDCGDTYYMGDLVAQLCAVCWGKHQRQMVGINNFWTFREELIEKYKAEAWRAKYG